MTMFKNNQRNLTLTKLTKVLTYTCKNIKKIMMKIALLLIITIIKEAVTRRCSVKKMFLEISQNSQKNTCARVSFLIKLPEACNFIKKETFLRNF